MEFSHQGIRCHSTMTLITMTCYPLRDTARMCISVPGHLNVGGPSPGRELILLCASGQALQPGCTVQFETQSQTFCTSEGLDQSPAGWTIIYSSESSAVFFWNTTKDTSYRIETSFPEGNIRMEDGFGLEVGDSRMAHLKNLMGIALFPARTYPGLQNNQQRRCYTLTTLMILIPHHGYWGSHGRSQRTDLLPALQPTLALTGMSKPIKYHWQIKIPHSNRGLAVATHTHAQRSGETPWETPTCMPGQACRMSISHRVGAHAWDIP